PAPRRRRGRRRRPHPPGRKGSPPARTPRSPARARGGSCPPEVGEAAARYALSAQKLPDPGRGQRRELLGVAVAARRTGESVGRRRMAIDLVKAFGQILQ